MDSRELVASGVIEGFGIQDWAIPFAFGADKSPALHHSVREMTCNSFDIAANGSRFPFFLSFGKCVCLLVGSANGPAADTASMCFSVLEQQPWFDALV